MKNRMARRGFLQATGAAALAAGAPVRTEGRAVQATRAVIAAEPEDASRAAAQVVEAGGNAMDAAAAACLAACLLEPSATDIGGYVLAAVVLEGATGRVWSLDANSIAPAAARPAMYEILPMRPGPRGINESEYGCSVRDNANVYGPQAVGVPGVMGGIGTLWERWGRAKWSQVVAPTQELAERANRYGGTAGIIRNMEAVLRQFPETARHLMPNGAVPRASDEWRRGGMPRTLARLSAAGWRDFYEGELGRRIADYVHGLGGALTRADLAAFAPRVTPAYETTYRKARVHSAILANGGLSLAQILNMCDAFPPVQDADPDYWHRFIEVLKLAWRDRLRYLADPDHTPVPVERLLSTEYAAGRVETLRTYPGFVDTLPARAAGASPGTIHLSTADAEGNLVAVTLSHGGGFGSCLTVPGTGITLGHGMCRFDPHPGLPNSAGPRKRPLNNTCPTILRLPGRDVALGLRGGRRIVSVVSEMCRRIVDQDAAGPAVLAAPRLHLEGAEPADVSANLDRAMVSRLQALKHEIKTVPAVGGHGNIAERLKDGALRGASQVLAVGLG